MMGEIADAMLNGLFCMTCGEYLEAGECGHPRSCAGCAKDEPEPTKRGPTPRGKNWARNRRKKEKRRAKKAASRAQKVER